MKLRCHCGFEIVDGTDDLPQKGHLVPDQEWLSTHDALDELIDATAAARIGKEVAYQRARAIISKPARLMWQCRVCGRLYVDGRDGQLRCFVPDGEPIDREILRSRPS
jgi:hypothetical protein